jgi:hypothetical protein
VRTQIPYTMAKFFFFEYIVSLFYKNVFTAPKETYSKTTQLGITFASGYLAGVICAIVSHPADSVVSLMGKAQNKGKGVGQIASEVGIVNLATKGLGTRVIMIGTLTGTSRAISRTCAAILTRVCRLPVVDLRLIQVRHGYGYHWWQVNEAGGDGFSVVCLSHFRSPVQFPFGIYIRFYVDNTLYLRVECERTTISYWVSRPGHSIHRYRQLVLLPCTMNCNESDHARGVPVTATLHRSSTWDTCLQWWCSTQMQKINTNL